MIEWIRSGLSNVNDIIRTSFSASLAGIGDRVGAGIRDSLTGVYERVIAGFSASATGVNSDTIGLTSAIANPPHGPEPKRAALLFTEGSRVIIKDLRERTDLNGRLGQISKFSDGRYLVSVLPKSPLPGQNVRVKPENLEPAHCILEVDENYRFHMVTISEEYGIQKQALFQIHENGSSVTIYGSHDALSGCKGIIKGYKEQTDRYLVEVDSKGLQSIPRHYCILSKTMDPIMEALGPDYGLKLLELGDNHNLIFIEWFKHEAKKIKDDLPQTSSSCVLQIGIGLGRFHDWMTHVDSEESKEVVRRSILCEDNDLKRGVFLETHPESTCFKSIEEGAKQCPDGVSHIISFNALNNLTIPQLTETLSKLEGISKTGTKIICIQESALQFNRVEAFLNDCKARGKFALPWSGFFPESTVPTNQVRVWNQKPPGFDAEEKRLNRDGIPKFMQDDQTIAYRDQNSVPGTYKDFHTGHFFVNDLLKLENIAENNINATWKISQERLSLHLTNIGDARGFIYDCGIFGTMPGQDYQYLAYRRIVLERQ